MTIDRRQLLAGAALASASLPLTVRIGTARAEDGPAFSQAPAYHRIAVGDMVVTALSDGHLGIDASVFPNVSPEAFAEAMRADFQPGPGYTAPVNAYVVQRGDGTVLIDAGGSTGMAPTLGRLFDNLTAAGIDPAGVETVLLTHLHPDHIGGLMRGADPAFPNAELRVREEEIAFWSDPATRAAMPEAFRPMVDAALAVLDAYGDRLGPFTRDGQVAAGIDAVFLPGHTPGHTGYRIADGDASLLLWGDVIHVAPVQMPRPERFIGFDVSPEAAVATRARILEEVSADRAMVGGMHLPFPGFGHVARRGDGYAFVRADWQYEP